MPGPPYSAPPRALLSSSGVGVGTPGGGERAVRVAGAMAPSAGAGQVSGTGATIREAAAGHRSSCEAQNAQFAESGERNPAPERAHRTKLTYASLPSDCGGLVSTAPRGMRVMGSHGTAEAGRAKMESSSESWTSAAGIASRRGQPGAAHVPEEGRRGWHTCPACRRGSLELGNGSPQGRHLGPRRDGLRKRPPGASTSSGAQVPPGVGGGPVAP